MNVMKEPPFVIWEDTLDPPDRPKDGMGWTSRTKPERWRCVVLNLSSWTALNGNQEKLAWEKREVDSCGVERWERYHWSSIPFEVQENVILALLSVSRGRQTMTASRVEAFSGTVRGPALIVPAEGTTFETEPASESSVRKAGFASPEKFPGYVPGKTTTVSGPAGMTFGEATFDASASAPEKSAALEAGGVKYDAGKTSFALLPWDAVAEVAGVFTRGAKKYAPRNWEKGLAYSRIFDSTQRHLTSWFQARETFDPDGTGLRQIAQAAWGCLVLAAYELRGRSDLDDRPVSAIAKRGGL